MNEAAPAQRLRGEGPLAFGPLDPLHESSEIRAALRAWMRLHHALCLRPAFALDCLERSAGDPVAALAGSGAGIPATQREVAERVSALARAGFCALPVTASAYPERLRTLPDAPPLLFVRGDVSTFAGRAVAIVGARAATSYGLGVARSLAEALAERGVAVVSGLARGIDAAAHRGALEAGGPTLAVQGCGPDVVYPAEHRRLRAEIGAVGAVLTELPLGAPPRAGFFPLRNRLISGLSELVVVVEARERSGSLITARHAADQGREVMAVPGPVTAPTSGGPNRLLRDGATPLIELDDVLDRLESAGPLPDRALPSGDSPKPEASTDSISEASRTVLQALRAEPLQRDALARRLGWATERLEPLLLELELEGWIDEDRDGRLRPRMSRWRGGVRAGSRGGLGGGES
jgi:DNA processing protein